MVKKINEYRCQLCNALDRPWSSFSTPSGGLYIEAHHVIPVSAGGAGVLGAGNVITVCPNHHRQLHYGRVDVMDVGDEFSFVFDGGEPVRIQKFQTPERQ
jgi:predicted HNH restriction endonuclease